VPRTMATDITAAFSGLRERLDSEDFLLGRGLANEVALYILPYDPARENEVRAKTADLVADSQAGKLRAAVHEANLWRIFEQISTEPRDVLSKYAQLEERRGSEALLDRIQKRNGPEDYVAAMGSEPREPGRDVLLITGVGQVYPFIRAHQVLSAVQPVISNVPVVMLYPGAYDGQSLKLFNCFIDDNYYRAFSLL